MFNTVMIVVIMLTMIRLLMMHMLILRISGTTLMVLSIYYPTNTTANHKDNYL